MAAASDHGRRGTGELYLRLSNLYSRSLCLGEEYLPTSSVKYGVVVDETGEKLGFRNGDKILSVDNRPVENFAKIVPTIVFDNATSVQVERDGVKTDIPITGEAMALLLKSKGVFGVRYPFRFTIGDFAKESPGREAGLQKGMSLPASTACSSFITMNSRRCWPKTKDNPLPLTC